MRLSEISTAKLDQYTKAADADYTTASAEGDYKKSFKRASGMMKASGKKIDNDVKAMQKARGVAEDNLQEVAPLIAAAARFIVPKVLQLMPKIGNLVKQAPTVIGNAAKQSAPVVGNVVRQGAEIAGKNAGTIGTGAGVYTALTTIADGLVGGVGEVYDDVTDAVNELTDKLGDALDTTTITSLAAAAVKYSIPIGIVLAMLYGGKKVIDKMISEQGVAEAGGLDNYRQRVQSQGFTDSPEERDADRLDRKRRHQAGLDRIADIGGNSDEERAHRAQQRMARDEIKTDRMKRDDDDWENTFDMMRDRMNRYQWSSQRDVDPEQLAAISNIKYEPRKKNEAVQSQPSQQSAPSSRAVDAKGRTQQQWMKLVKAKFPDAKIMQSKMIDGPVFAMLSDGRKLSWNKVEQGVEEATGDKPFDSMMKNISTGTAKQKTADRKEQRTQTQQQARDAFGNMFGGGNPADKLKIKEQGVTEGSDWETRHNEFVTVGDKATPEQINKIVKALVGAAQQAGSKRGVVNRIFGKQSNDDLARMAHGAETLAKNIQKNSNAKPGSDERKELGQHLVYAVSLLKRISGKQGVAEGQFDTINDDDFYEYNVDSKEIVARTSVKAPTARALTPNKSMEWPGRDDKHKITKGFKAKSLKRSN